MLKLRSLEREDLAGPLDECHRDASYKRCRNCRNVSVFYNRCERVGCPICASRLARDRRESVAFYAREVQQPKHVVLTVYSVEKLTKAYVRQLKADWRKLRNRKFAKSGDYWQTGCDARTRRPLFRRTTKWRGGFWSLDVTWTKPHDAGEVRHKDGRTWITEEATPGGFHIHFHALIDADYIDRDRLEDEWCAVRKQSIAVCRVYDVGGKDYTAEVCKYVSDGVSLGNWPADVLVQFYDAFNRERTFDCFGVLYKLRKARREALEALLTKWDTCECGCQDFDYLDEFQWEAEGCVAARPPPEQRRTLGPTIHPELFAPIYQFPR